MEVDHINHDPLDNRRCNLRICTKAQNLLNRKVSDKERERKSSNYKGVYWLKSHNSWRAVLRVNGVYRSKIRSCEVEAAKEYDKMALAHAGEFACLNFPQEAAA
jgi:hypothetical protein